MTRAFDLLDDSFPHGTLEGHDRGCRGTHCPAPMSCATVRTRYAGDWTFRKRLDAGWSLERIIAAEREPKPARRPPAAAPAARPARPTQRTTKQPARVSKPGRPRSGIPSRPWTAAEVMKLRELHAKRMHDRQIGEAIGRPFQSVQTKRQELRLPAHPRQKTITHGGIAGYKAGCKDTDTCPSTPSCIEAARAYWRDSDAAKRLGISISEYRNSQAA